jgi:glyoxylase-like metal-dependent hydrolase (beta-lactamase superfamily II)
LTAFRDYCWDSWSKQKESLAKLLNYSFEWVLPGHGERVNLPAEEMRPQLQNLVTRIGGRLPAVSRE